MQRITEWKLCPLGLEWSDYFQGFGTSFTKWQHAIYGIGHSQHEAAEDCLEQIAMSSDCDIPADLEKEIADLSRVDEVDEHMATMEWFANDNEDQETPWIHFGIRYNTEEIA